MQTHACTHVYIKALHHYMQLYLDYKQQLDLFTHLIFLTPPPVSYIVVCRLKYLFIVLCGFKDSAINN